MEGSQQRHHRWWLWHRVACSVDQRQGDSCLQGRSVHHLEFEESICRFWHLDSLSFGRQKPFINLKVGWRTNLQHLIVAVDLYGIIFYSECFGVNIIIEHYIHHKYSFLLFIVIDDKTEMNSSCLLPHIGKAHFFFWIILFSLLSFVETHTAVFQTAFIRTYLISFPSLRMYPVHCIFPLACRWAFLVIHTSCWEWNDTLFLAMHFSLR